MGDNEMMCAMESRLKRIPSQVGLEPENARPALNPLSYRGSYGPRKAADADI